MPIIRTLYIFLACFCLQTPVITNGQKLIQVEMEAFVQSVPLLPCSVAAVHQQYTKWTKYGEKFSYSEYLGPLDEQVKKWIFEIHNETIKRKIQEQPRKDMTYEVQYDDERLQLLRRPLAGPQAVKKTAAFSAAAKDIVAQLVQLEKSFDLQNYYQQYNHLFKEGIGKEAEWNSRNQKLQDEIPMVQTEYGLQKDEKKQAALSRQMIREKTQFQDALFSKHYTAWTSCFQKYSKGVAELQQLLQKINYGQHIPAGEQKILLPLMADVQARALESIEKMIWEEMILLERGKVLFDEQRIGNFFMNQ